MAAAAGVAGDAAVYEVLDVLSAEVGKTAAAFTEAQRNQERERRRVHDMLEDTLKKVGKARIHMQQKAKHVTETTKSFTAKFDAGLGRMSDALKGETVEAVAKFEEVLDSLEARMSEAEAALARQREARKKHIEETLGPIRDESARLFAALEKERRARKRQEEEWLKLVKDETEALNKQIEKEKFEREQELKKLIDWSHGEQQQLEKHQFQVTKDTRAAVDRLRIDHQAIVKLRVDSQHVVAENIAAFVGRCTDEIVKEADAQVLSPRIAQTPTSP
jgi:hypothetical protein